MSTTQPPAPKSGHVFALAGLPGCGKSTVADIITEELDHHGHRAMSTEVSDFVRTMFEEESDDDINDNELGRWAAEKKEEHGNGYFLREMALTLEAEKRPHIAISGLRSPEEAEAVREVFGSGYVTVISVWTLPDIRFERKYGESPSTDHPEWDTFVERNERETHDWGCAEFFTDEGPSDYVIPNNGTLEELEGKVQAIVRNEVTDESLMAEMFATAPFPNDTATRAAQYL
jgi:dephospho-CoA kinase